MKSKFDYDDVVRVIAHRFQRNEIKHCEGVILGKAQNEDTNEWSYSVAIRKKKNETWHLMEYELQATGKKADPKEFITGEGIKVSVI